MAIESRCLMFCVSIFHTGFQFQGSSELKKKKSRSGCLSVFVFHSGFQFQGNSELKKKKIQKWLFTCIRMLTHVL